MTSYRSFSGNVDSCKVPKPIRVGKSSFELNQAHPRKIALFSLNFDRRFHRKPLLNQSKARMLAGIGLAGLAMYHFPGTFFTVFFGGLGFLGYKIYKTINSVNNDMEQLFNRAGLDSAGRPRRSNIKSSTRGDDIYHPGKMSLLETSLGVFKTIMPFFLSIKSSKDACLSILRDSTIQLVQQHIERNTQEGRRLKSILRATSSQDILFWPVHYENFAIVNQNSKFQIKFMIINGHDNVEVIAQGHSTNYQDEAPEVTITSVNICSTKTGEQISIPSSIGSPTTPRGPIREAEYREL
ncbi:hypothetical protein DSO57_1018205 [Entomophthora muscae]|nr:hypothetical protein DSO57_1018205 [Entomophthora muscae]